MFCKLHQLVIVFFVSVFSCSAWASSETALERIKHEVLPVNQLITAVQSGGHILYMRYAITDYMTRDKFEQTLDSCKNQRTLSAEGRIQAKDIGRAIKAFQIPIGKVWSSPFCRCKNTAMLSFGEFEVDHDLQFSMPKEKKESRQLADYLYGKMKNLVLGSNNAVFVGHASNLKDGLGIWAKPEGVINVFQNRHDGLIYRGEIAPDDWPKR